VSKFAPVDHKESDADYVALVRDSVAKRLDTKLLPIEESVVLHGRWRSSVTHAPNAEYDIEHLEDGTLNFAGERKDAKPGKWALKSDVYIQTTWVPPMPEYGIEEESWNQEAYRCALTADGRIVYWNGDGSLVVTLTKIPK
jgi:hypothetical protein